MGNRVTIMDIAKKTNVTHTTVYKALNNKQYVKEETKKRILEAAASMGYRANKVAQSLVRKSQKIGIVIEGYYSDYSLDLIRGIKDGLNDLFDDKVEGVFTEFETSYDREKTLRKINDLKIQGVDGIIFAPYAVCQEHIDMIELLYSDDIPVVLVTADIPNSKRVTTIRPNGRLVGSIGAELLRLCQKGKTRAVFVGNKNVVHHQEIIDGFTEKSNEEGYEVAAVYETQDDDMIAYYSAERLLKDHPQVSGIYIGTSHSVGVCRKIIELGLDKQISVIGTDIFNELIEYIEKDTVKATIYQNSYMQGKLAVSEMFKYLTEKIVTDDTIYVNPEILLKCNYKQYMEQER
ncbi:MAG: LacI family transcriptional regulator [Treponema sp.]|nr:LacI family transcriptional regulator [Treponema sp.]